MLTGIRFDRQTVTVAGGGNVTIAITNTDAGIAHNFAVYSDSEGSQPIAGAGMNQCVGPCSYQLSFATPPAGRYYFRCDVHPADMFGTFIVQ